MLDNTYNPKISKETAEKISSIVYDISDMKNSIPGITKSAFNFKGRKSEDIATAVLSKISNDDSVICDPFFGSGTFLRAGLRVGLDTIGIELDNYTYDAFKVFHSPYNHHRIETLYLQLKEVCFDEIMQLYETSCCGHKNYIKTLYFDPETNEYFNPQSHREIKEGKNIKLYYACPICGNTSKKFEMSDNKKLEEIEELDTEEFPSHKYIENSRINITSRTGADKYDKIFTRRNQYALLLLQNAISELDNCIEKEILQHALISSLSLCRIAQYGSSTDILYHVMKEKAQDMNVWSVFENKYAKIMKFITLNHENRLSFNDIKTYNNDFQEVFAQTELSESIDIIYTDPPYTDQVPYLERNQLYRDWLQHFVDADKFKLTAKMLTSEFVVSNAPTRPDKTIGNYFHDLDSMFESFSKVIKTDGLVCLTLNLGKRKFFKTLSVFINSARRYGFEYISRIDLEKSDPTLRKQSAWKDTLSKEMIVFFIKLPAEKSYWYLDDVNIELEIARLVYKSIIKQNDGITITTAYKLVSSLILGKDIGLLTELEKNNTKKILNEQFIIDPMTSKVYINPDKLYISVEDNTTLFNKLYDIVPIIVNNLLNEFSSFTLQDLYFELSNKVCSGDPNILSQILDDPERELHIKNLVENYCDTDNKSAYVKKKYINKPSANAIDISVLDGYDFESILKELLIAEGYSDVIRIGGAGDRGIDLRAKKSNPSTQKIEGYIFQAKRWIADVGGRPIQRLHSMMMQYPDEIHHAECITTSNYTTPGKNEAKSTGVKTTNGLELMERLNNKFPGKYYHGLLDFEN